MKHLHPTALWNTLSASPIFWTLIALIVWKFSSQAVHDIAVYSAFVAACVACVKNPRRLSVWRQPAGVAFIAVVFYMFASVPFATCPMLSLRDLLKLSPIFCGAFALSVLLNTPARIGQALLYTAIAITLCLGYHLGLMVHDLRSALMAKAHVYQPFIFNHSNVASIMAGLATFVFVNFAWQWRREPVRLALCLAAMALCLAYQVVVASRGPQIAFALACTSAGLLLPGWRWKALWFGIILVAGGLLVAEIQHINPRFAEKKSMSTFSERNLVWSHTWELTKAHPWDGYGYGKRTFTHVYYNLSSPPKSIFKYPHCHEFWLKLLFEFGWPGLILNLTAWLLLGAALIRRIFVEPTLSGRMLPGAVGVCLLFIHLYGLGDYPDNIVQLAQFWLVPLALVLTRPTTPVNALDTGDSDFYTAGA